VLIIADIVQTITIDPTLESAFTLALIVVVRTFLSFSLEIELDGTVPLAQGQCGRPNGLTGPSPPENGLRTDAWRGHIGSAGVGSPDSTKWEQATWAAAAIRAG
jgi:hypothetical protein